MCGHLRMRACLTMNQYLSKTWFICVFVCARHCVLARANRAGGLLPVHETLCTSAECPGTNSSSTNSDACLPSDPLTGQVRSPAQRVVAALTAAEAGP